MTDLVQKIREVVKEFGLLFYSLGEPGKHPLYFLLSKDRLKLAEIRVSVFSSEDFMLDLCRFPDWLSEAADEIERLEGKLLTAIHDGDICKKWLDSLSPERQAEWIGFGRGWQMAHESAGCGHARANWRDPKYGTLDYDGAEFCEMCVLTTQFERLQKSLERWRPFLGGIPFPNYVEEALVSKETP